MYLHCTNSVEDVTASPSSLMARQVYVPESSGLTYFMLRATYPKSCIVVNRFAEILVIIKDRSFFYINVNNSSYYDINTYKLQ